MSKVDTPQKDEEAQKAQSTLSRLIAEQRVTPIDVLEDIVGLWPTDDDADDLINFVLSERQARIQLDSEDRQSK